MYQFLPGQLCVHLRSPFGFQAHPRELKRRDAGWLLSEGAQDAGIALGD